MEDGPSSWYIDTSTNRSTGSYPLAGDWNGDGRIDLFVSLSGTWRVYPGKADGLFDTAVNSGLSSATNPAQARVFDFNGDGFADLLYEDGSSNWKVAPSNGGSTSTGFGAVITTTVPTSTVSNPVLQQYECVNDYYLLLAAGTTYTPIGFSLGIPDGSHNTNFRAGDFNGDGLDDFLFLNHLGTGWVLKISTGDGLVSGTVTSVPVTNADKVLVADYDGDGRDDLIRPDGDYWRIHRSTGTTLPASYTDSVYSPGAASASAFVADIAGSGRSQIVRTYGSLWYVHQAKSALADVVTAFTNGLGQTISAEYASLAQTDAYALDNNLDPSEAYVRRYGGPRYVVVTETHDDGIAGTRALTHTYDTAFVNTAGRGWQSFRSHRTEDPVLGTYTLTEYDQTFPTAGMVRSVEQRTITGDKAIRLVDSVPTSTALTGTTPPRQFRRIEQTTTEEYEVGGVADGQLQRTIIEDPSYDSTYGYVTDVTRTVTQPGVSGEWVSTTDFDRSQIVNSSLYCLGLPGLVATTNSTPTEPAQTRKLHYVFNSDCSINTITDESDSDTSKQLRTEFGYDGAYGNVDSVSEYSVAAPGSARTTTFMFDADGQFPEDVTVGGVNLTTHLDWDPLLGVRTSVTGPDGLTTSYDHDAFGRLIQETRSAGETDYAYLECSVCFPQHAAYFARATDSTGAIAYTFFDRLGRPVGTDTPLAGGARSREEIRYEATGRVDKHTQPYVAGEPVYWVDETYDLLGRLVSENAPIDEGTPSGAVTGYEYRGPEVWVTDPKSHVTKYRHNALGQIERVTDALGGQTAYSYYPFGELHTVVDNAGNTTTLTYDARGYKSDMDAPDLGTWHYDFNAFGELESQTDAKGQTVTVAYDAAGRLDSRDEPEGHTDFDYYAYNAGLGQAGRLHQATSPGNLAEAYVYSTTVPGAPTEVTRTIGTASYTFDYAYDAQGRLEQLTYPQNVHGQRLAVEYLYDAGGLLSQVRNAATPSLVYYSIDAEDALGRTRQATLGNALVEQYGYDRGTGRLASIQTGPGSTATVQNLAFEWDLAGNLSQRETRDASGTLTATDLFSYDALDRLTDVDRNQSSILSLTYDSSHLGNIQTKSDLAGTYAYGQNGAGPHAVTSIGAMTFGYDANGNMTLSWPRNQQDTPKVVLCECSLA